MRRAFVNSIRKFIYLQQKRKGKKIETNNGYKNESCFILCRFHLRYLATTLAVAEIQKKKYKKLEIRTRKQSTSHKHRVQSPFSVLDAHTFIVYVIHCRTCLFYPVKLAGEKNDARIRRKHSI